MSDLIKTLKSSETGNDVYPNIKPDNIPSDAITSAKISDGAVTTDKLASDSVTTAKIHNGAVTTAKIEDEGVTTAKIGALAVTTAKIDTGAVTSNKLAESSVTGTKINDGAVSYNKLASALKNLIDGKASQTDLQTLQTAVNGKQDKIDSTHKLDADLVDDSTSTNKFVTATDKTTWNGKQDALVSGTNIKTINNQSLLGSGNIDIQGGGGTQLYAHQITIVVNADSNENIIGHHGTTSVANNMTDNPSGLTFNFTIINSSSTPITDVYDFDTYLVTNASASMLYQQKVYIGNVVLINVDFGSSVIDQNVFRINGNIVYKNDSGDVISIDTDFDNLYDGCTITDVVVTL